MILAEIDHQLTMITNPGETLRFLDDCPNKTLTQDHEGSENGLFGQHQVRCHPKKPFLLEHLSHPLPARLIIDTGCRLDNSCLARAAPQ
jgi:hypothetical protein